MVSIEVFERALTFSILDAAEPGVVNVPGTWLEDNSKYFLIYNNNDPIKCHLCLISRAIVAVV